MNGHASLDTVKGYVNSYFQDTPPWKIVAITAGTTYAIVWFHELLTDQELGLLISQRNRFSSKL